MDIFTREARLNYIRTLAKNAGLRLKEHQSIKIPHTDVSTIYMPVYEKWVEDGKGEDWECSCIHEILHHVFKQDLEDIKENPYKNKIKHSVWNILCDWRIESQGCDGYYPGRDRMFKRNRVERYTEIMDKYKPETMNRMGQILLPVQAFNMEIRKKWDYRMEDVFDEEKLSEEHKKVFDKIKAIPNIMEDAYNISTPTDIRTLAEKIYNVLDISDEEEEQFESGELSKEQQEMFDEMMEELGEEEWNSHSKELSEKEKVLIDYIEGTGKQQGYADEIRPTKIISRFNSDACSYPYLIEELNSLSLKENGISESIKRYLMVRSKNSIINNQISGRFRPRSAWKSETFAGKRKGMEIFKREYENDCLDTAISILTDHSGSMFSGSKIVNAAYTMVQLNKVLSTLQMNFDMKGFSFKEYAPIGVVYKGFGQAISSERIINKMCETINSRFWSDNSDGESIMWAAQDLLKQPQKRKIMFVISDGSPAASGTDAVGILTRVLKDIQKYIDVYGIGLCDSSVKYYYKNNTVINTASQLNSSILNMLKRVLV